MLFGTLLFSLGSTGEFNRVEATSPITIDTPKSEGKKLSLWYNEPAKDWENKHCQSVMVIWAWYLAESSKNVFSLMKNALDWHQAVRVSIRTGIVMEQPSHLGSIREKLAKGDKSGAERESSQFLTGLQKGLGPIKILGTFT